MPKAFPRIAMWFTLVIVAVCRSMAGDTIRWDFAGSFSANSPPLPQPGAVPGALITGSLIIPDSDMVTGGLGTPMVPSVTTTYFTVPGSSLNITLSVGGNSYDYSGTFYFLMSNPLSGGAGTDIVRF